MKAKDYTQAELFGFARAKRFNIFNRYYSNLTNTPQAKQDLMVLCNLFLEEDVIKLQTVFLKIQEDAHKEHIKTLSHESQKTAAEEKYNFIKKVILGMESLKGEDTVSSELEVVTLADTIDVHYEVLGGYKHIYPNLKDLFISLYAPENSKYKPVQIFSGFEKTIDEFIGEYDLSPLQKCIMYATVYRHPVEIWDTRMKCSRELIDYHKHIWERVKDRSTISAVHIVNEAFNFNCKITKSTVKKAALSLRKLKLLMCNDDGTGIFPADILFKALALKKSISEIKKRGLDSSGNTFKSIETEDLPEIDYSTCVDLVHGEKIIQNLKKCKDGAKHILVYGKPGTGKTTYAKSVVAKHYDPSNGLIFTSIGRKDEKASREENLLAELTSAITELRTKISDTTVLIIDEADELLSKYSDVSKRELVQLLDETQDHCIWVINDVANVHEAVKRRMYYAIHMGETVYKNANIWEKEIQKYPKVKRRLTLEEIELLNDEHKVPVSEITKAIEHANLLISPKANKSDTSVFDNITQSILSYNRLILDGQDPKKHRKGKFKNEQYSTEYVNIVGCSDPTKIIDNIILNYSHEESVITKTCLLYGVPGTGKSELAKYLSSKLGVDYIIARPSDVQDMYVGNTEKNIAKYFKKAVDENKLLIWDEVDSFLFPREMASRSWESSQTNEFLVQLENFTGMCICTSNFMGKLDTASIRRFTFKYKFDYLTESQRLKMFVDLMLPISLDEELTSKDKETLKKMNMLTPSDFVTVQRRYKIITADGAPNNKTLIDDLKSEIECKVNEYTATGSRVGF